MTVVQFRSFEESTAEEWAFIDGKFAVFQEKTVDHIVESLKSLAAHDLGYPVDRYVHSLQTATRAMRAGADEETIVCALVHDIGDSFSPHNHGPVAAAMLAPFISAENAWMVHHHEAFQGFYYAHHFGGDRTARDAFRGHPAFERTAIFTDHWDQMSFDPGYDSLPIEAFMPVLTSVFSRPAWGVHTKASA